MAERRDDYRPAERGHEPPEPRMSTVAWFGVGLAVFIVACVVFSAWFAHVVADPRPAPAEPRVPIEPLAYPRGPDPQPEPRQQLEHLRQTSAARLESYGWVDRERGIVHIPIERAMELAARRGMQLAPAIGDTAPEPGDGESPE